jgi:predicted transcriptional regulator
VDELKVAVRAVQIYAERHPRPVHVNQVQAAQMIGVSARTISNYIKSGAIRLNKCGMIPIGQIDALIATVG